MSTTAENLLVTGQIDWSHRAVGVYSHRPELLRGTKWMDVHRHLTDMSSLTLGHRLLLKEGTYCI